jgi:hypothetical protein
VNDTRASAIQHRVFESLKDFLIVSDITPQQEERVKRDLAQSENFTPVFAIEPVTIFGPGIVHCHF